MIWSGATRCSSVLSPLTARTPDHIVVIKHVPAVGDSRRPSTNIYKLIMGARDPLTIFNECEDSLRLPSHLRLDNSRRPLHSRSISSRPEHKPLYPILSPCRTCSRRPSVKPGHDVVNPWEGAESTIDGPDEAPPVKSTLQTSLPPTKIVRWQPHPWRGPEASSLSSNCAITPRAGSTASSSSGPHSSKHIPASLHPAWRGTRPFTSGNDLKTSQAEIRSFLAEFLTNAGTRMISITSYNHGRNLSAER